MYFNKIVSLIPSLTELLIDLGLKDQIAGRTKFCIHPAEQVTDIPTIGGTKNPRIEKIRNLKPDFILANREENRKEDIEELSAEFHIHLTDINTVEEALQTISELGGLFGVQDDANQLVDEIKEVLNQRKEYKALRTAYFIWKNPWMVVGADTYVNEIMKTWGLENVFEDTSRYPEIALKDLREKSPELVILSSEPYPFKEKHIADIIDYCPDARIELLNGEWFSWYGSRMLPSFKALNAWRNELKV